MLIMSNNRLFPGAPTSCFDPSQTVLASAHPAIPYSSVTRLSTNKPSRTSRAMREVISVSLPSSPSLDTKLIDPSSPFRSTLVKPVRLCLDHGTVQSRPALIKVTGVQIGNACWELYTIEHGLSVSPLPAILPVWFQSGSRSTSMLTSQLSSAHSLLCSRQRPLPLQ